MILCLNPQKTEQESIQSVTFKETPKQKIEKKVQQLMKTGSKTTTAIVVLGLILILMSVIIFAFLKASKRS